MTGIFVKFDRNFQHFALTFRIMTATFNILRSPFELWLQNIENCSHMTAYFKSYRHVIADFKSCSPISNYDTNLLKVAVKIQNFTTATFKYFAVTFWIMTATFSILRSYFELWLQLSTFCSHISNYDRKMLKFAVIFGTFQTISTASGSADCESPKWTWRNLFKIMIIKCQWNASLCNIFWILCMPTYCCHVLLVVI